MSSSQAPPITVVQPGAGPATARWSSVLAATSPSPAASCTPCWNAGPEPARMIEVISPAGFEHFFREMADLTAAGPPQLPEVMALADRYGLQGGQPDWLPDLIARYPPHPAARRMTARSSAESVGAS